jgi:hypothetical protein
VLLGASSPRLDSRMCAGALRSPLFEWMGGERPSSDWLKRLKSSLERLSQKPRSRLQRNPATPTEGLRAIEGAVMCSHWNLRSKYATWIARVF